MSDNFDKGLQVFREVYGDEAADGCRKGFETGDDFTALHIKFSMELPFGQVWTREEQLSRRDRSLAVLGMCIGQRSFDEIRYHTIMGVANGLTRAEIEEVFFSAIPYCGFPAANTAKAAMLAGFKVLEEQGKI